VSKSTYSTRKRRLAKAMDRSISTAETARNAEYELALACDAIRRKDGVHWVNIEGEPYDISSESDLAIALIMGCKVADLDDDDRDFRT